jgi:hypothetical protein
MLASMLASSRIASRLSPLSAAARLPLSAARQMSVYAWGCAAAGLSPASAPPADVLSPLDVSASIASYISSEQLPASYQCTSVTAGKGDNSAFVLSDGETSHVVVTGSDKYGASSGAAKLPEGRLVERVNLGPSNYSAHATQDGKPELYSWGYPGSTVEGYGQLGLGGVLGTDGASYVSTPQLVDSLVEDGTPASMVDHGAYHSLLLSPHSEEVLTCGAGT